MSIAFDSATDGGGGTIFPTYQFSHTVSGANTILFAWDIANSGSVSGITYGGVAMTLLNSVTIPGGAVSNVWYLINPPTGSNFIVFSGTGTHQMSCVSYNGVNQTSPINASNTNTQTGGLSFASSITPVVGNCWVLGFFQSSGQVVVGANTVSRTVAGGSNAQRITDNNSAVNPAALTTLNVSNSFSVSANYSVNMIALAPAPVPSNINGSFLLNFL